MSEFRNLLLCLGKGNVISNMSVYDLQLHHGNKSFHVIISFFTDVGLIYPLPDMPIIGSSNSAANKDMMSKILTNGDTIF